MIFTLCGGYLINNYFDIISDTFNSKKLQNTSEKYYLIGFGINFLLSFVCLLQSGLSGGWFQFILICHFSLFIYSFKFQYWPLIGNILVSILCSLAIAIPEFISFNKLSINTVCLSNSITSTYVVFCFLLSLMRELVKDIEDIEGDLKVNSKTLPIVLGIQSTNMFIGALNLLIFILLVMGTVLSNYSWIHLIFYVPMLCLNFYLTYIIISQHNCLPYSFLSQLIKFKFFIASLWLFIKLIA